MMGRAVWARPRTGYVALFIGLLALVVCALQAAPASAILVKLPRGGYANYDAMSGSKAPRAARIFDNVFSNLDYSGGPVMPSNTNYTVVWQPSNYGSHTPFQPGYTAGVDQFFTDMAADSGQSTNSDAVATQYNDVSGNTAAYNFSNGGVLVDTDPLPSNGCPAAPGDICLNDTQLQSELDSFLASKGKPHDMTHEYYLLTPPDVASCFDSSGSQGCSANADLNQAYCAYHSSSAAGYIYANISDLSGVYGCDPFVTFCPGFDCSYDNGPADGVLSAISHEHNESITDPQPNNAWTDWGRSSVGGENGDKCNNDAFDDPNVQLQDDGFGDETPYNETINGDHYLIQLEWSNQGKGCLDSFTGGGTHAHASFTSTPGSGNSVSFDASASTATGGVAEYVWQFNDGPGGGQNYTVETTNPKTSHTFPAAGTYTVALTVMASDGTSNGTASSVTAGSSTPPTAAFTFTPPGALEGSTFSFDASSSVAHGGTISSYGWSWGDGSTNSTGVKPTHVYSHFGTYTVKLTVTDSNGLQSSVSHTISVTDESPTASFTFAPGAPSAGTTVSFDGTGSSDPDGHVSSYSWTFGDGGTSSSATPTHAYTSAGNYLVMLQITDSDGQTASVQHTVSVAPGGTAPSPTAAFTTSPGYGLEGSSFSFDGSASSVTGGTITGYSWNFGDGGTATGATAGHVYLRYGTYAVTLTVTSNGGRQSSVTHSVTVGDEAPTASFSFSPGTPTSGSPVAFNGAASHDPDGGIVSYAWQFGDGGSGAGSNPVHSFRAAGTYTVTLIVQDSDGQSSTTTRSIVVIPAGHGPLSVCTVPKLKGKTLSQAKRALQHAHCRLGKVTKHRRAPKHKPPRHHKWELLVASQGVRGGSTRANGTAIALKLAYKAVKTGR